jgi:hypothetical protein
VGLSSPIRIDRPFCRRRSIAHLVVRLVSPLVICGPGLRSVARRAGAADPSTLLDVEPGAVLSVVSGAARPRNAWFLVIDCSSSPKCEHRNAVTDEALREFAPA